MASRKLQKNFTWQWHPLTPSLPGLQSPPASDSTAFVPVIAPYKGERKSWLSNSVESLRGKHFSLGQIPSLLVTLMFQVFLITFILEQSIRVVFPDPISLMDIKSAL